MSGTDRHFPHLFMSRKFFRDDVGLISVIKGSSVQDLYVGACRNNAVLSLKLVTCYLYVLGY